LLVGEHFGVGQASRIVDGNVYELPSELAMGASHASDALACAIPGHPVSSAGDPAELLDVEMDQLARPLTLVAVGRLDRRQPRALAQSDPLQDR
jgi:hypothetical protein